MFRPIEASIAAFLNFQNKTPRKKSPFYVYLQQLRQFKYIKAYEERKGINRWEAIRALGRKWTGFNPKGDTAKLRKMFMKHNEDILTMQGADLDVLAEHFHVDTNLPTSVKQEQVYQSFADKIKNDPVWTKEKIERDKKFFLKTLESAHFPGIACNACGVDEKTVMIWLRTDPNFADSFRAIQIRTAEQVGAKLLVKGIKDGDLGALAILYKGFGPHLQLVSQTAVDMSASAVQGMDISKLSLEEQDTLLRLMRKAQDNTTPTAPTHFIEEEEPSATTFLEHELPAGMPNDVLEPLPVEA